MNSEDVYGETLRHIKNIHQMINLMFQPHGSLYQLEECTSKQQNGTQLLHIYIQVLLNYMYFHKGKMYFLFCARFFKYNYNLSGDHFTVQW